jgi:hypothetical protein
MTIKEAIEKHHKEKNYVHITRIISYYVEDIIRGYIVDYSKDFIILEEVEDFRGLGFVILPFKQILKIRYNKNDRFYDKIMEWEKEKDKISLTIKVDLTNWQSIFQTFQEKKMNVFVQCEALKLNNYATGPITNITKNSVYIQFFDQAGFLDDEPTQVYFEDITKVVFDDRYMNIMSKYLRKRKQKNLVTE